MGFVLLIRLDSANAPERTRALGLQVALKGVLPEIADSEGVALFKRELTIWSAFRDSNVVSLLEIVDGGDAGWLAAMDWCIRSLRDVLNERGRLSLKASTDIMGQLIDGLAYAYNKDRVLHLDLKPENVLYHLDFGYVRERNAEDNSLAMYRYMLSDWGIASVKQSRLNAIMGNPVTSQAAQHTFNNCGTLFYMAPERFIKGLSSSIGSDMFSLGMIYLEMLTGRLPFRADTHPVEILRSGKYLSEAANLLDSAVAPNPVSSLIKSLIAYSPLERPRDYSTLKSALMRSFRKTTGFLSRIFN
jgi:serine/threonine protein kinase